MVGCQPLGHHPLNGWMAQTTQPPGSKCPVLGPQCKNRLPFLDTLRHYKVHVSCFAKQSILAPTFPMASYTPFYFPRSVLPIGFLIESLSGEYRRNCCQSRAIFVPLLKRCELEWVRKFSTSNQKCHQTELITAPMDPGPVVDPNEIRSGTPQRESWVYILVTWSIYSTICW